MPRDTDQRPGSHPPLGSFFANRRPPLIPCLVVAAVFLLAFLFLTVPNWDEFARNFSQFPALWQISSNRREIIYLVIRVCSPLLLAAIAGAMCWLWYTVKAYFRQERPPERVQSPASRLASSLPEHGSAVPSFTQHPGQGRGPPLPTTPLPPVLSQAPASVEKGNQQQTSQEDEPTGSQDDALEKSPDEHDEGGPDSSTSTSAVTELGADAAQPPVYVTITVLKALGMVLHAPGGKRYRVPLRLNAKEVQLVAYLAWLHGQTISLDKLREHIFGYGRADEDATPKKLQDALDSAKKEIRRQIRQATVQVNQEVGYDAIPPDLDIFAIRNKRYGLSEVCRVSDLSMIEAQHQIIQQAFDDGLLVDSIPDAVKEACDRLRKTYTGDFLADLLQESPEEVGPWVRKPFTLYKDYYLQAVLYAAEYEMRAGQQLADERLSSESETAEARQQAQRAHYSRAAQLYRTYAMRACDSRVDLKVTFGGSGRAHGERVDMSERTLRRCITLYGILGSTHMVNQVYSAYYKQMKTISAKAWEPSKETLQDLQGAQAQTNAYRFPTKVMPHEPPPPHLEMGDRS